MTSLLCRLMAWLETHTPDWLADYGTCDEEETP